jgi:hypothetical protein
VISYFKYTDGSDFTLNESSYSGLINVIDSTVYTGSVFNSNSQELSSTNTFLAKCFEENLNFNFSSSTSLKDQIQRVSIYPRTILTLDTLKETLDVLSKNNAIIFAAGVRFDNKFLNPLYRSAASQSFTNCITSFTDTNLRPIKLPLSKLPVGFSEQSNIDGFSGVFAPTSRKSSILLTDGLSGFKYFNSVNLDSGMVTGLSNSISALMFGTGYTVDAEFTHDYLHYNRHTGLLYQTNDQDFSIFSIDYSAPIPHVFLQDKINISALNNYTSVYNVTYGRNFRCSLVETGTDIAIEFYRLNDTELITIQSRTALGFKTITNICQRFEDDLLVVVGTDSNDLPTFATFDIEEIANGNIVPLSYFLDTTPINATFAECTDFDSDIIVFKKYSALDFLEAVEYRSISAPSTPLAQYTPTFDIGLRVNDIVSTMSVDLSADNTVVGTFYNNYDSYFIDLCHSTSNVINTAIVTDSSFTVDTKTTYTYLLPKDLKQNYTDELDLTRNSSIGLTLNGALHKIIQDTLLVYYNFCQQIKFDRDNSPFLPTYTIATFLQSFNLDNLLLYSNESVNIGTINRLINSIIDIQTAIASELGVKY